jgi:phosphoribosylformylglycinamidine (FGAM) synthase-like enzyme
VTPRYCEADPFEGGKQAVAETWRNLSAVGAKPMALTDNLNFGNPERPEIMWQFGRAVEGITAACKALDIPITGGNVSLYNETDGKAIYPTPVLGVVGLIEDSRKVLGRGFRGNGDAIVLLGDTREELGGSEYVKVMHGVIAGMPPDVDLKSEKALQQLLLEAAREGLLRSAHDCAEGGLAVTLAECSFGTGGVGLTVDLTPAAASAAWTSVATLFSESASRVVVSVARKDVEALLDRAAARGVPARNIGTTGSGRINVSINGESAIDLAVSEAESTWDSALGKYFKQRAA